MARRRRPGRWANQAALEALLRFGPEQSGLAELQLAAQGQFTDSVRSAHAGRRAIGQAISSARPDVAAIYNRAGRRVGDINEVMGESMEGAPASIQAAMAQEQAGFGRRLQESKADALTGLKERRIAAREGEVTAIRAARDEFAGTLQQIMRRKLDLARESGAFTALRTGELRQAAQQRADEFAMFKAGLNQDERQSLRSAGINPDTGRPIKGGPNDPNSPRYKDDGKGGGGKGSRATREQIAAAQDVVDSALSEARRLRQARDNAGQPFRRRDIADLLRSGSEAEVLHDPKTGKKLFNPDGTARKIPGVPQIKSQLLLSAALDQAYLGYVTRNVERRLRSRGIKVRQLGLTPYAVWRRETINSGAGQHPH